MKFGLSDATIAKIHAILKKYHAIEKAMMYGSRAKGNYRRGSDIDLTLHGEALTNSDLMNISRDLEDSSLPYFVDLSIFHHIDNEGLRDHIARVGQLFYERAEVQ